MRKILFLIVAVTVIGLVGCKTNEANYRAAYEIAKNKRTETGDSTTTAQLRNSDMPRPLRVNGDTLMVLTKSVGFAKESPGSKESMQKYCVVVAKFRQLFNAKSMAERLAQQEQWRDAFVLIDRDGYYYVVAASTASPELAKTLVEKAKDDKSMVLHEPFPFLLRPAHLAR